MKMKIQYKREPDGCIHVFDAKAGSQIRQIDSNLKVEITDRYTFGRVYPNVINLGEKAPTKHKAYQQLASLELKLAKRLRLPNVTVVRTFHDINYKEAVGYPKKPHFVYHIERVVCIYGIKENKTLKL
jgi:hypothetical protein